MVLLSLFEAGGTPEWEQVRAPAPRHEGKLEVVAFEQVDSSPAAPSLTVGALTASILAGGGGDKWQ